MLDKAVYSITALGEIAELFTRAYPDKPFEEAQRAAYRIAARLEATGPERDLAEQTVEKLEWLAREWGEATVIKVRVDKPLAHWTEVRVDMNRGELRHFAGSSGGRDFPMIPRADALALLREKGAKDAG